MSLLKPTKKEREIKRKKNKEAMIRLSLFAKTKKAKKGKGGKR